MESEIGDLQAEIQLCEIQKFSDVEFLSPKEDYGPDFEALN